MKTAVGLILLTVLNLIYFYDLTDSKSLSWGWGVYFHSAWCCIAAYFIGIYIFVKPIISIEFQLGFVAMLYCIFLGAAFVLNYYGVIEHTYGLIITSLALLITTLMIVLSGLNHGLFKKE